MGSGLAGLAAATALAETGKFGVSVYEAAPQSGGRCRSFFDEKLGTTIDNGNHLVLSGNRDTMRYLERIGGMSEIDVLAAVFPFVDLKVGQSWELNLGNTVFPWWVLSKSRRIPDTGILDYLKSFYIGMMSSSGTVAEAYRQTGHLYERFWKPFSIAALNTEVDAAAAALLRPVFTEIFAKGGPASKPVVFKHGLGAALVDPAIGYLQSAGGNITRASRCGEILTSGDRVTDLRFGENVVPVGQSDIVVCAVPSAAAAQLGIADEVSAYRPIVNAHFRHAGIVGKPRITGVIGGLVEWIFVRSDIASVTVSAATDAVQLSEEELINLLWRDVAQVFSLPAQPLPIARIIKEKRATPAQTQGFLKQRPKNKTRYVNLWLAGDWVDTGLPATIEGAIRSGHQAAKNIVASEM